MSMTSSLPMSPSGDQSMSQPSSVKPLYCSMAECPDDFRRYFELERTLDFCRHHAVKKLALQLPDHLLWAASCLCQSLSEFVAAVLADSSFSPCCVDEIAAEHIAADAIVHYGHRACLSQTTRIPVLHVFGKLPINVPDIIAQFATVNSTNLVVVADLHYVESLEAQAALFPEGVQIATPGCRCAGLNFDGQPDAILYVGNDDSIATLLALHFNDTAQFVYDPAAKTPTITRVNSVRSKALMRRRRFLIEKVKDSTSIGIVAGTLAVSGYLDCIRHLQKVIRDSGRRCYTVAIGKLNAAKIANFVGIDIFVMVACPVSCVIDSLDFSVDVVTPVDVDLALNTNRCPYRPYSTDFHSILGDQRDECECCSERDDAEGDEASPRFSLISGKLVSNGDDLTANAFNTVAMVGNTRSFSGLNPNIGATPVLPVERGQIGIPSEYSPL